MIPSELSTLVEQQAGNVKRTNHEAAEKALCELGIDLNSEFAQFYLTYKITLFDSNVSYEQLCDIAEPSREIAVGTRFIHDVWRLPDYFICFTSCEGEGGYLYNKNDGTVWDFSLANREKFIRGMESPTWPSFFDFMIWYLT